jgi:transcriptional regulator with XRE-family HTH domain
VPLEPHIGKNIKEARLAKGLNQSQLGERCRPVVLQQSLSRYESGEMVPTISTLIRIAQALEVDIVELMAPVSGKNRKGE